MRLRCATINLRGTSERWEEERFAALLHGVLPLHLDLIAFQETTIRVDAPGVRNQAREIGGPAGLPFVAFAPYGNESEVPLAEHGGVAIASRWPFAETRSRALAPGHAGRDGARVALAVRVLGPEGAFDVTVTHLSWMPEESDARLAQARMIAEEMSAETPCLLLGDLNAIDEEPAIRLLREHRLRDAFRAVHPEAAGLTWDNRNPLTASFELPDRRIDYIFCSEGMRVRDCRVFLDDPAPVFATDHYGVFAELEWSTG